MAGTGPVDPGCELCTSDLPAAWTLTYVDGDPDGEGTREALLTVGNGYLASRGAAPESSADGVHYPGTYLAGFHNRLPGDGRETAESIVNLPNWLPLTFRPASGDWYAPGRARRLHEHRALDLRSGIYRRELVVVDRQQRRTRLRQRRLVSMAAPHLAALHTTILTENWSGRLEVRSGLDGGVVNANAPIERGTCGRHLDDVTCGTDGPESMWMVAETTDSRLRVALGARTRVSAGSRGGIEHRTVGGPAEISQVSALDLTAGEPVLVDKTVAVFSSRDRAVYEPLVAARTELAGAGPFEVLAADHAAVWAGLWQRLRLDVGDEQAWQLLVRVQTFHLLQTLSPHTVDLDAGVPARGLHGEGYHGHIFWDELFVYPFLDLRLPELTRALLEYRHRRLGWARRQAAELGRAGALFPWQSASSGRDESPARSRNPVTGEWIPDHTNLQHHVNLAVSYSAWRYWETTADLSFLATTGIDLLVETARFWAGAATYDPADDRFDIRGVMGPDEYHDGYPDRPGEGLDNSAYVNVMVAWTLARACEAYSLLERHPGATPWFEPEVGRPERDHWDHVGRRLRLPFLADGMLAQFEGYADLAELDWEHYRRRYGDLRPLGWYLQAEGDSTNRYRVSKQADVLMLLYLLGADELADLIGHLGYDFDRACIPATVDHYLARTTHGSTLSRVAHAWVLARTDRRQSWNMLLAALGTDLADLHDGSAREGIHLGATAGTLDILQRCYTGLEIHDNVLRLDPLLPEGLDYLRCTIRYRGRLVDLTVDHREVRMGTPPGDEPPIPIMVRGRRLWLAPGATATVPLANRDG
ncbi:glycosyl hydrolase family 65 protein [Polymorphospora sp. NPDC050346]|uniref:glycoside hydrolase family 65 protein n=1 Tax=Polymorphospora sp. NPDC050346 TaxID=3155780 RepID=UPI0033ECB40A